MKYFRYCYNIKNDITNRYPPFHSFGVLWALMTLLTLFLALLPLSNRIFLGESFLKLFI